MRSQTQQGQQLAQKYSQTPESKRRQRQGSQIWHNLPSNKPASISSIVFSKRQHRQILQNAYTSTASWSHKCNKLLGHALNTSKRSLKPETNIELTSAPAKYRNSHKTITRYSPKEKNKLCNLNCQRSTIQSSTHRSNKLTEYPKCQAVLTNQRTARTERKKGEKPTNRRTERECAFRQNFRHTRRQRQNRQNQSENNKKVG
jgi:hypothetical protein